MNKLNGTIHLLIGNHDKFNKFNISINNKIKILDDTIYTINHNNCIFKLFHYPLYEWPNYYEGAIHLHGHTHGKVKYNNRSIDVGYDNNNFRLLSIIDILKIYECNK
jgi:calcineurin-like phosphoesterase family protein